MKFFLTLALAYSVLIYSSGNKNEQPQTLQNEHTNNATGNSTTESSTHKTSQTEASEKTDELILMKFKGEFINGTYPKPYWQMITITPEKKSDLSTHNCK
jgi:hypothetical protein